MRFNKVLKACLCGSIIAHNENAVELAKKFKREAVRVRLPSGYPKHLCAGVIYRRRYSDLPLPLYGAGRAVPFKLARGSGSDGHSPRNHFPAGRKNCGKSALLHGGSAFAGGSLFACTLVWQVNTRRFARTTIGRISKQRGCEKTQ